MEMGVGFWVFLLALLIFHSSSLGSAQTDPQDATALTALASSWENKPPSWGGMDPCGDDWVGIKCTGDRVTSIQLSSMGLKGSLTGDIESLSELQILDLSYNDGLNENLPGGIGKLTKLTTLILVGCSFSGEIPDLSSLKQLVQLSLNSNKFTGSIPPSIGSLPHLYWLDIADNKLTGPIPVSDGTSPGLDMLLKANHFHFGNNLLSGSIPEKLFSPSMFLIHLLFDNNNFTGRIPSTLGLVKSLQVIRLDRNSLSGPVPPNFNNLTNVAELYMSNNRLSGPLPNLTGMNSIKYLDLSRNSFDETDVPSWFLGLQSLTTLVMEYLRIAGEIPKEFFNLPQLQTLRLRNNLLNGTLDLHSYGAQLQLVDLQNNRIEFFNEGQRFNNLVLVNNPFCSGRELDDQRCRSQKQIDLSYSTSQQKCSQNACLPDQYLNPNCGCSYPYLGTLYFRALSFSDLQNVSHYHELENNLAESFHSNELSVESVYLHNISLTSSSYLEVSLQVFPSNEIHFSRAEISKLGFILSNQTFKPPPYFGPFYFKGIPYNAFQEETAGSKSKNFPLIIGASVGGFSILILIAILAAYASHKNKKPKRDAERSLNLASWDSSKSCGSVPQLKGARCFSCNEMKQVTNCFSEENVIGSGGYGKVYKGTLADGRVVAIKRAQQESVQGGLEFKTEVELLSRVHHKNIVGLVGFCFDQGEQILVYDYISNGSLRDSLAGNSGVRLDWKKRLKVALGTAKGLAYLHELANPPIIHRDVKTNNILLDEHLNGRVSDLGLSKALGENYSGHVTTQVKGTMGYLDPEYYVTQQLSEKSDVYSFGVVMLELLTARKPIERGKYVVKELKAMMKMSEDLYGLHELLDPAISVAPSLEGFNKFVDLAMKCVQESSLDRPSMSEVVKEIEVIMQEAGLNPNADSASTSASYEGAMKDQYHHPYNIPSPR